MRSIQRYAVVAIGIMVSFMFFLIPSDAQTDLQERYLTSDMVIEDEFQPGSGLPVGKIQLVWGNALVFHRDPTVGYRAQAGLPLYAGDIIRTRAVAWVQYRLLDGSQVTLAPDTDLTVNQSICSSARKSCSSVIHLNHGDARFQIEPPADLVSYEFKVQTELAAAATGAADFVATAVAGATGFIALEKSRLAVSNPSQPEEVSILSGFQKAIFSGSSIPPTVETISGEEIETVLSEFYPVPPRALFADSAMARPVSEVSESPLPDE